MRHLTPKIQVVSILGTAVLAFAGCGGDDAGGGSDAGSPLAAGLSYLPENTPFAVAIDTDVNGSQFKAVQDITGKFPGGDQAEQFLEGLLEDEAGDLDELEKLAGNEFVVGAPDAKSFVSEGDSPFVGAIQTKDEQALSDALKREKAKEDGEAAGAKLYKDDDGDAFAVDGDVLVVANNKQVLTEALERAEGEEHLTEDGFDEATEGLPEDALVRVYGDIEALLASDPSTAEARKVKWVDALRTFGITLSVASDEVKIAFRVNTDGSLSDEDLPIASGPDSPEVLKRAGEIGVGLRGLDQTFRFIVDAVLPATGDSGSYEAGKQQVEKELKIDIEKDLVDQLAGDISLSFGLDGKFGARADLEDPAAFQRTIDKIAPSLPGIASSIVGQRIRLRKPSGGEDFYTLEGGGDAVVFAIQGDALIVSNDAKRVSELAAGSEAQAVPGANGAVTVNTDAEEIAKVAISDLLSSFGPAAGLGGAAIAGPLNELIGSLESSTDGLSGEFKVTLD